MSKILYLIAPKQFRDEEFFVPYEILRQAGHDITVISTEKVTASGKMGGSFKVHKTISEVDAHFYQGLIIAGGPGSKEYFWPSSEVKELILSFHQQDKMIASICSAAALPAIAGIAKDKKMSCFPGEKELEFLKAAGAIYTAQNIEVDGKLITADGPAAAEAFAHAILKQIS